MTSACAGSTCAGSGFNRVDDLYDGEGHRVQIKETTAGGVITTTGLRYAGDTIVAESVNGSLTRTYATDDAGRIMEVCDPDCATGTVYLPTWNGHGDATGLWRQNADGTLTLANSYTYGTWGTPTTTVAPGFADLHFRFLYVGASDVQWDASFGLGLLYMHARHYSPTLGRFLQPDPARADGNLYRYAENSPVTNSDPSGQCVWMLATEEFGPIAWGLTGICFGLLVIAGAIAIHNTCTYLCHGNAPAWTRPRPRIYRPCFHCWLILSQDRRLSPGEVSALDRVLRRNGVSGGIHGLKGKGGSANDLFKKPNGEIVLKPRSGSGPGEDTGWNVKDLKGSR